MIMMFLHIAFEMGTTTWEGTFIDGYVYKQGGSVACGNGTSIWWVLILPSLWYVIRL